MSFFTDGPRERPLFPVREQELFGYEGRPWMGPPNDHIVPALLPWARPLGRSERTIVALRGIEVWPEALTLRLAVYSRDSLQEGRSGSLIDHRRIPDYNALLVGVLYPDGSRGSSESISVPSASEPAQPVLRAVGGGGTQFHLDHQIFLWPLPGDGPFTLVIQWLDRDIKETHTELDGAAIRAAAADAGELWPGLPKRPGHGVALRRAATALAGEGGAPPSASADEGVPPVRSAGSAGSLPRRSGTGSDSGEPLPLGDAAAPGEPFPNRNAFGAAEGRGPAAAPRAAGPTSSSGFDSVATTQPVTAPGEPSPPRSPSVLLPHLAEASLLPRRNVALGPDRPTQRPPGTAAPLPRRTPSTRADSTPTAHPPAGLAALLAQSALPAGAPEQPPQSLGEPAPLPPRSTDVGDSPTIALAIPEAAGPLPQPAPPRTAGEGSPLPQPSQPPIPAAEAPTVARPLPLPQPSRPAKQEKPARGGWARRRGARDPGE